LLFGKTHPLPILLKDVSGMHNCQALLISCLDFRIQQFVESWARQNLGGGQYDRIALAGGVKDFPAIMKQIDLSVKLHGIKKVVLMNHEDCGAYLPAEKRAMSRVRIEPEGEWQAKAGGETGIPEKHRRDLLAAASAVTSKYPDLTVETYFVHLNGQSERI
jgi:hypothetical protein